MPNAEPSTVYRPEVELRQRVIRCGCDDPLSHARQQLPCPTPRADEDLGRVSYYSPNPLKRLRWRLFRR